MIILKRWCGPPPFQHHQRHCHWHRHQLFLWHRTQLQVIHAIMIKIIFINFFLLVMIIEGFHVSKPTAMIHLNARPLRMNVLSSSSGSLHQQFTTFLSAATTESYDRTIKPQRYIPPTSQHLFSSPLIFTHTTGLYLYLPHLLTLISLLLVKSSNVGWLDCPWVHWVHYGFVVEMDFSRWVSFLHHSLHWMNIIVWYKLLELNQPRKRVL